MCSLEHEGKMVSLAWSNVIWYIHVYTHLMGTAVSSASSFTFICQRITSDFCCCTHTGNRQTSICRTNHINWKIFDYQLRLKFQEAGLNTVDGGQAFLFYNRRTVARKFRLLVFHESSSRGPLIRTLNIVGFCFKFAEIFFFERCSPGADTTWNRKKIQAMGLFANIFWKVSLLRNSKILKPFLLFCWVWTGQRSLIPRRKKFPGVSDPAVQNPMGYQHTRISCA